MGKKFEAEKDKVVEGMNGCHLMQPVLCQYGLCKKTTFQKREKRVFCKLYKEKLIQFS